MTQRPLEQAIVERLALWQEERVAGRLWARDGSLWKESGKPAEEVTARLGWLDLPDGVAAQLDELLHLARDVRADGYTRAAVLGMGGSSLAPELFSRIFGGPGGAMAGSDGMELRILDSTHPDAVRGFREWAQSARTLFCVSSKSGSTTEPNAFHAAMSDFAPALDFVAITDPGSSLADLARAQEFRAIVDGRPDVGGRYSALSAFGLLPAALLGVDVARLLESASAMARACRADAPDNPGLGLGAWMGEAALAGRDKLTILAAPRLASFGDWAEQLVAESTGKAGRGIVPIVGEPLRKPEAYPRDRCFVVLTSGQELAPDQEHLAAALGELGHPVVRLELDETHAIGAELVRWEIATAAAGIVLGIDPFDQPNVQESKDATRTLLESYRRDGTLPSPAPVVAEPGAAAFADSVILGDAPVTVDGALRSLLGSVQPGDYFAILAYLPQDPDTEASLQRLRGRIGEATGVATTLGFGPRFLHSTGQLHKGGPASGVYLQITADPRRDLPIPGWEESFGVLVAAQALGDLEALQRRGRRVLRLHFGEADAVVERLATLLDRALPEAART
jgi:transaldolase / glucose-6-phosphate isomerase